MKITELIIRLSAIRDRQGNTDVQIADRDEYAHPILSVMSFDSGAADSAIVCLLPYRELP